MLFRSVYLAYGLAVVFILNGAMPNVTVALILTGLLYICDRISMHIGIVRSIYLNGIILDKNHMSQVLSTGIALDHVVTVCSAPLTGLVWTFIGPQYIFFIAAALSLINVYIASKVKIKKQEN